MKTITYNGSSKVIKRIVELLNRKAPLPLDGGGDPDFGTNGQVLTTDGLGATSWTTPSGGDSVEWTQIQASGTKIAEIEINGTSTDVYAPNGGGGGGGHTIVDPSGTSMTQRDGLQFLDAHLADDSVNDRIKVEVVKIVTENEFNALDETDPDNNGIYLFEKSGGIMIDASQVAYDGGTVADSLDFLTETSTGVSNKPQITYQKNGHIVAINIYGIGQATNMEVTGLPTPLNDAYYLIVLWSGSSMTGSLQYVTVGGSYKWIINNSASQGYGGGIIITG